MFFRKKAPLVWLTLEFMEFMHSRFTLSCLTSTVNIQIALLFTKLTSQNICSHNVTAALF